MPTEQRQLSTMSTRAEDLVPPSSPDVPHYSRPFPPRSASQMARYEMYPENLSPRQSSSSSESQYTEESQFVDDNQYTEEGHYTESSILDSYYTDITDDGCSCSDSDSDASVTPGDVFDNAWDYYRSLAEYCSNGFRPIPLRSKEMTPPPTPESMLSPRSTRSSAPSPSSSTQTMDISSSPSKSYFSSEAGAPTSPSSLRRSNGTRRSSRRAEPTLQTLEEQPSVPEPETPYHMAHARHNSVAAEPAVPPTQTRPAVRPRAVTESSSISSSSRPRTAPSTGLSSTSHSHSSLDMHYMPPPPPPNTRCQTPTSWAMEKSVFEDDSDDEVDAESALNILAMRLNLKSSTPSSATAATTTHVATTTGSTTDDKLARRGKRKDSNEHSLRSKASRFLRDLSGGARKSSSFEV